ncbi:hypothetical protein BDV28DRAFT_128759 [Aspergillus coremiiformis]|uniref:Uncharacterized protein n=1 Tax=Aspergillus coremiiformis TaxID=138285 RepID=A0A5N6ZCY7_9EURO|nr:hypothetical protein BDV28DRAFT_128759 [Aspergillus coremiiformis]
MIKGHLQDNPPRYGVDPSNEYPMHYVQCISICMYIVHIVQSSMNNIKQKTG